MSNIMVDVSNNYMKSGGASTAARVTVTYFDISAGSMVTKTKDIANLNPYPTNPWAVQRLVVVNHPVLVKKSVGIEVTIESTSGVGDPNHSNNKKIAYDCSIMVY